MPDLKPVVAAILGTLLAGVVMDTAQAQTRVRLPQIGLPLPRIGLPHPPMGLSPVSDESVRDPAFNAPGGEARRPSPGGGWRGPFAPVVLLPPYYWPVPVALPSVVTPSPGVARGGTRSAPVPARPATGTVWFDLEPARSMQIFVDGYYIGTTDERGVGIELEAGLRRLELRAPGYEPLIVGVRVEPNRTLTYRDRLRRSDGAVSDEPRDAASPAPPGAARRMSLYVIPGCYAGNVPPTVATLPAGCDAAEVREIR